MTDVMRVLRRALTRPWRALSVRARTTLMATSVVALALGATGTALVGYVQSSLIAELDTALHHQLDRATTAVRNNTTLPRTANQVTIRVHPRREPPAGATETPVRAPLVDEPRRTASTTVQTPQGPRVITASTTTDSVRRATAVATRGLLLALPAILALVAVLTWTGTRRALRPVEAIRAEFADITTQDLHRRVPVPDAGDEIARLGQTMNHTLDCLDDAVTTQRRFIADASHELRSPLAMMRTPLEVAAHYPDQADWPQVAADALEDLDRLHTLTSDLLLLARLENPAPTRFEPIDLTDLVHSTVRRRAGTTPLIHTADLDQATVHGHPTRLVRLLTNLLDNAQRHATTDVHLSLRTTSTEAILEVADDGPGIAADNREHVFGRFTRLDHARHRDHGGSGLGLPLARQIATTHAATLTIDDSTTGGALLRTCLPLARTSPNAPATAPR